MKKISCIVLCLFATSLFAATENQVPATASTGTSIKTGQGTPIKGQLTTSVGSNQSTKVAAPANGLLTRKQPTYTLRLNSNPTTGYSWLMVSYPSKLLTVVKHQYIPNSSPAKRSKGQKEPLLGAGGSEIWQFKAKEQAFAFPQLVKIKMMYARSWDVNDQSTTQTFYAVIK